jgi:hypothetical protein
MATPRGLFPSTQFLAKIFQYSATLVFFLKVSGVSYQLSVISYQLTENAQLKKLDESNYGSGDDFPRG